MQIEGSNVLDLFAGTGNMSLEFASREANRVVSVDQNRKCIQFIEQISKQLEIDVIQSYSSDAEKYLEKCSSRFDLIFADPPYAYTNGLKLWNLITEKELLEPDGYFILEHGKDQDFEGEEGFLFSRKFGNVNFTFFQSES
tara:strand:+ start:183 stop:605 length:423 start_codon:yes stop_codon:yes gene_type:complete